MAEKKPFNVFDIWEELGTTEHMGGIRATKRLIELCKITAGQYIMDIGCGTGYTACLLAKEYDVAVVAADISPRVLEWAKKRIVEEGVADRVKAVEADAEKMSFPAGTFDVVIAESVLVHCDPKKAASEVYRVLKHGGLFGNSDVTYLKPPAPELVALLSSSLIGRNIGALQEHEWQALFREAGFADISSTVHKINLFDQFLNHLQVDGVRKYFSSLSRGLLDPKIRGPFFKREVLRAWREYLSYVGYGLYVCRKD